MAEEREFLAVFLPNQLEIKAFVSALIRDRQAAEDVFQDVAGTLWKKFDRYDPSRPFLSWARGVARNLVREHWRTSGEQPLLLSPEAMDAVQEAYEETEQEPSLLQQALQVCVAKIQGKWRELLALRYEEATALKAVAERMGMTANAIHQTLFRIRKELLGCVTKRLHAMERGER
jgi:RNA polymerase sigma-70 factor (ECF subfamily)